MLMEECVNYALDYVERMGYARRRDLEAIPKSSMKRMPTHAKKTYV